MTVKGLWPLLQPTARPIKLETLRNKRLAIDASIWLHQFLRAMRDKEGNALRNAHILGFFRRICKLLFYSIKPVFVFDGGAPTLKRATIAQRRKRRAGVADTVKKTAEKILVAQMQLRAIKELEESRNKNIAESKDQSNSDTPSPSETQDVIATVPDEGTLDFTLSTSTGLAEYELWKKRTRDEYNLPPIKDIRSLVQRDDFRFATDEELRSFINDFKPEELDMDSDAFRSLPAEIQYEIITDLKLKSRQTSWDRLQEMIRRAPTALDFSKLQIEHLMHRNNMTQRLFEVTGIVSKATGDGYGVSPVRIAGERNREYVLVKNEDPDAGLGWSLPIAKRVGSKARPVRLDDSDEEEMAVDEVGIRQRDDVEDNDVEFEAVEIPGMEDKVLKAIQASARLKRLTNNMEQPAEHIDEESDDDEPLFLPSERKRNALRPTGTNKVGHTLTPPKPVPVESSEHSLQTDIDAFMDDDATVDEVMERFRILEQQQKPRGGGATGEPGRDEGGRGWSMSPNPDSDRGFWPDQAMSDISPHQSNESDTDSFVPSVNGRRSDRIRNDQRRQHREQNNTIIRRVSPVAKLTEDDGSSSPTRVEMDELDSPEECLMTKTQFHQLWLTRAASARNFTILYPDEQERRKMLSEPMEETIEQVEEKLNAVHRRMMKLNSSDSVKLDGLGLYEKFLTKVIAWKKLALRRVEGDMQDDNVERFEEAGYGADIVEIPAQEISKSDRAAMTISGQRQAAYLGSGSGRVDMVEREQVTEQASLEYGSDEFDDDFEHTSEEDKENVAVGQDDKENIAESPVLLSPFRRTTGLSTEIQGTTSRGLRKRLQEVSRGEEIGISVTIDETGDEDRERLHDTKGKSSRLLDTDLDHSSGGIPEGAGQSFNSRVTSSTRLVTEPACNSEIVFDRSQSASPVEPSAGIKGESELLDGYISDEEAVPSHLTAENAEFARFVSELSNKDLSTVQAELDTDLRQLSETQRKAKRDADDLTQQMVSECQELLRLFGIPYLVSPMEAEAQCAELMRLGLVDGIVTDDSDVFLFGGMRVYKNMFNQSRFVECYLLQDLERDMQLSRDKLVDIAYLLGSDYTEGLPGVGPVLALEILNEFGQGLNGLKDFRTWWEGVLTESNDQEESSFKRKFRKAHHSNVVLSDDFPNPRVREAYYHPTVDSSEVQFKWGDPDLESLREYLMDALAWPEAKVSEVLVPVIKQLNSQKLDGVQMTIDSFFDASADMTPLKANRAHKSKRVQSIVNQWKSKKRLPSVSIDEDATTPTTRSQKRRPPSNEGASSKDLGRKARRTTRAAKKPRPKSKNRSAVNEDEVE